MRTSAFIYGAIAGIVVYRMISSKGSMALSMVKGTDIGQLASTAKDMMMGNSSSSNYSSQSSHSSHSNPSANRTESVRPSSSGSDSSSHSTGNQHGGQTSTHSKAANLKQLKDFILANPDVKHEVEQILKETQTAIPGL